MTKSSPILVPFLDLQAQYKEIKTEVDAAITRVVESANFVLGPEVAAFEAAFAEYVGARCRASCRLT